MEPYVAEQIAREMLERSPELRAEFARKVQQDDAFASNPSASLDFFLAPGTSGTASTLSCAWRSPSLRDDAAHLARNPQHDDSRASPN